MFIPEMDVCELDNKEITFSCRGHCSASLKLILKFHLGSFLLAWAPVCLQDIKI